MEIFLIPMLPMHYNKKETERNSVLKTKKQRKWKNRTESTTVRTENSNAWGKKIEKTQLYTAENSQYYPEAAF